MRRPVLSLLLLSSLTFCLGLGAQAMTDSDEAFYAEAAREMVESGDWLTPHFNYQDRWQKPILYYWLTAGTYLAAGVSESAARWWSALSGVGLVLLTWAAARRMGRPEAAWLAGAIVATCYGCFAMARLALPDLPLAFLATLAIWSAFERRWLVAGAAAGLGLLMKGPIAIALPALVLLPVWWHEHRLRQLPFAGLASAALVCVLVGVPWYAAMTIEHGPAYLQSFFIADNLERFATDRFNDPRPVWFYLPIILGGLLPWTMYLVALPWRPAGGLVQRFRTLTTSEWRLLAWAGIPLVFFTLSVGKQPRYVLPVLPPLAVLVAGMIAARVYSLHPPRRTALRVATFATAVLYAVLAVLLLRARPLFVSALPALTSLSIVVIAASAIVLAAVAATAAWRWLPATLATCSAALLLALQFGALAGARPEPIEQMAAAIQQHRLADDSSGAYQVFVRNLIFYTRQPQVELYDEARALDFLRSPARVLLVVRATDVPRLEAISGVTTKRLAEVTYLDPANVRLRTLLAPIPAQDLDVVVLVANR